MAPHRSWHSDELIQFVKGAVLVDALHDLHARTFIEFRQWSYSQNGWVLYAGGDRKYFYHGFEMRVTFSGRKYFESLVEQATQPSRSSTDTAAQMLPQETVEKSTLRSKKDSSPQQVLVPESRNPKALVSHGIQDRSFVERFAGDLRKYGVDAWCCVWEIKPGDSIRAKIDQGLEGCEFFIIVLSRAVLPDRGSRPSLMLQWLEKPAGSFGRSFKLDDCNDLPPSISALCWEDFANQPYDSALERVLNSIFDVDMRPPLGKWPSVTDPPGLTSPVIVPPRQKAEPPP